MIKILTAGIGLIAGTAILLAGVVRAADSDLTQVLTQGTLTTSIRTSSNVVVPSPVFPMSALSVSAVQQASTGTYGAAEQRIVVDNAGGTDGGWTLTLNANNPSTDKWTSAVGGYEYDYNGTAATGQLTVDPSAGTLTAIAGGTAGVTLGTASAFSGTGPVTLVSATASAAYFWNGYVTGIGLSQTIPASQPAGSYTLNMTQTVTAT